MASSSRAVLVPYGGRAFAGCLGAALLAGVASAASPELFFALAGGALSAFAFKRFPLLLVLFYALFEPLQDAFASATGGPARIADEGILLFTAAVVLAPLAVFRPAALLRDRAFVLAALFAVWNVASAAVNGVAPNVAAAGVFVTLDYVLLFLVLRQLPVGEREARALAIAILGLGAAAAFAGLVQLLLGGAPKGDWQVVLQEGGLLRVPALFSHPNDFGYFMLAAVFVAVGSALTVRAGWAAVLLPVAVAGLGLSVSRSSVVALLLGLGTGGVLVSKRLVKWLAAVVFAATTALAPFVVGGIAARIEKVAREGGDARFTYARQALPIIERAPLFGVGPGRFGGAVAERYGSAVHAEYGIRFDDSWMTVDSFWLHAVVESGLVGAGLLLLLLAGLARECKRELARSDAGPWQRALLAATPMLIAAHVLINVTSMALEANTSAALLWLIAGVALSRGARVG